jgi:hypothetical protein
MKLRIRGNSLRLRLTQTEVAALRDTGFVEETVHFSAMSRLVYAIERSGGGVMNARFDDGRILVQVPESIALEWCNGEGVGIDATCGELKVLIEKDWQCLAPRDEDESDAFPHPKQA